ncbi:MAG: hypothetical protein KDA41_12905, partial [Planctomycetales bacterium]|nr:hypothetical protein [Planctomycetales bacterium]
QGRLLVGFSKSGWGAWSLLLRHPDTFQAAAAWDAPLMQSDTRQFGMGPIFGDEENFAAYEISRLLPERRAELASETRLALTGYGNFRAHHEKTHALLTRLEIAHHYRDGPQRRHHWESGWLPEAVALLLSMGPPEE